MKKWTKKEVDFLKKNYLKLTYNEMASHLKRKRKVVGWKLNHLGLKKSKIVTHSSILKKYYQNNPHHMKGVPKPEEQKSKISESRKKYLKKTDSKILNKIYKKMANTKRRKEVHLGENNPMYGKKRPDLSKRNREQWNNLNFRKKMRKILSETTYKGSKRQKDLYNYLIKNIGRNKLKYNDWKTLDYKYEIDISIPSVKVAIEWDGYNWHYKNKENKKRDLIKNSIIIGKGWRFIRIIDDHLSKKEVKCRWEGVLNIIEKYKYSDEYKYTGGFYI